jgi:hypothetical protein
VDGGHWIGTFTGTVLVAVAALPVAVLAVWALARLRQRAGAGSSWAWRASAAEVGMLWWTVPVVRLTLLPGSRAGEAPARVFLVPLQDLPTWSVTQVVGNLALFAAVGALGPVRFAGLAALPRVLALAAAGASAIEVAQYALALDRVSSVDDVLVNAVGAGLAALLTRRWWRVPVGAGGR